MDEKKFNECLDVAINTFKRGKNGKGTPKGLADIMAVLKVIDQNATEEQKAIAMKRMNEVMSND